jgi:hypothetical protein
MEAASSAPGQLELGTAVIETFAPRASPGERRSREYRIRLAKDDAVRIDLESQDFDPLLRLEEVVTGARRPVAVDDDGGSDLNSRLRFVAPHDGDYVITAIDLGLLDEGGDGGRRPSRYRLTVAKDVAPLAPPPRELVLGREVEGVITEADSSSEEIPSESYSFRGEKGRRLVAVLETPAPLRPVNATRPPPPPAGLALERLSGGIVQASRLRLSPERYQLIARLPETGPYKLTVGTRFLAASLAYTLNARLETVAERPAGVLIVGRPVSDRFTFRDPETTGDAGEARGLLAHNWRLVVRRGQNLKLQLCAKGANPILLVIGATAVGPRLIASSEASAPPAAGTAAARPAHPCGEAGGAELDLHVARDEVLQVVASPGRMVEADYSLTALAAEPAPSPPPQAAAEPGG